MNVNKLWTIAYRNPRANTIRRVGDWAGTWQEAFEMASEFGKRHPELQVWYVPTFASEADDRERMPYEVASGALSIELMEMYLEDHGNVLVDTGRRVRLVENGTIDH